MLRPRFVKGHALGNDYIVVRREELGFALDAAVVSRWCDRHCGIGGDGIIEILAIADDVAEVVVWNADGSVAEVSGNGLRIAAAGLAYGPHPVLVRALCSAGRTYEVRGVGEAIVAIDLPPGRIEAVRTELMVGARSVRATLIDIGNPHVVVEASEVDDASFATIAPLLENLVLWPARRNVERVAVVGPQTLAIDIFERGVGLTSASGTGASAASIAAVAAGLVAPGDIRVSMLGGAVRVRVSASGLTLSGPVEVTFEGRFAG